MIHAGNLLSPVHIIHSSGARCSARASWLVAGLVALAMCAGCEPQATERSACEVTADCVQDMVCVNERCRRTCNGDDDCDAVDFCINGFCLPSASADQDAAFADASGQDRSQRDASGADSARFDSAAADASGNDAAAPDAARPDAARPDAAQPDACVPACQGKCAGADNGCGGSCPADDCGSACCDTVCCPSGQVCQAGQGCCQPLICADLGHQCGGHDNGCGGQVDCGDCADGETCSGGQCVLAPVSCSGISADPDYELCEVSADHCAGLFTDGAGCVAFCAAAGLVCTARYGGEPGCLIEPQNVHGCADSNGHMSDWCVCGRGQTSTTCAPNPGSPPQGTEKHYSQAVFSPRSSWVLDCRDYAYTARFEEHTACDSSYVPGSGRGTATFSFNVNRGTYEVYVEGRHTSNRNPAGALVTVTSQGQTHSATIMQRDDSGAVQLVLHGRYCLEGTVSVVMDSSVSAESDSVRRIVLVPN